MTYLVTFDNETQESFTSITKAHSAIEQSFQCGSEQELKEVKESLRVLGSAIVNHCMCKEVRCFIDKR